MTSRREPQSPAGNHRTRVGCERRARTRARLLAGALPVFADHGLDARVIDLVIRQAEVSRGTFYNHFNTNEDLFTALTQAVSDEILTVVDPLVLRHDDPAIRLACGIRLSIGLVRRHPLLARFLVRGGLPALTAGSLTTETIPREVRAGIAAGRFSVAHERLAFDLVLGSVMAAFHTLLTIELPEDYLQDLAQAVLQSLGVAPAEAHRCARVEIEEVDLPEGSLLACTNRPERPRG